MSRTSSFTIFICDFELYGLVDFTDSYGRFIGHFIYLVIAFWSAFLSAKLHVNKCRDSYIDKINENYECSNETKSRAK